MSSNGSSMHGITQRPAGYVGPDLNPEGLILLPKRLADGVYALMANVLPKDNNGVLSGSRAALVVDSGINAVVAEQIMDIAQRLSDAPLRYLVNTSYHGDHSFGNSAFPAEVTIISSRRNKQRMRDLEREKRNRTGNLRGNDHALADVTSWRTPDIGFERYIEIDLGGLTVELWYFGPGNALGDTIVYVPKARVAFTGNHLPAAGLAPMLLELDGGVDTYIHSLKAMRRTLDVKTIVPGHGPIGDAAPAFENLIGYLGELQHSVRESLAAGRDLDGTQERCHMSHRLRAPAGVAPSPELTSLASNLHRLNVLALYRAFGGEAGLPSDGVHA